MTISAKIIADSISPWGKRITTMQLRYPRFIHPEFMTHRVFGRNASSSRAVPVERLIQDILRDPAIPSYWGKNQPGMQAGEDWNALVSTPTETGGIHDVTREAAWLDLMHQAVAFARAYAEAGYHKQIVNRILEPWAHINVVVTATEWNNFFALRDHKDAQPEIRLLAKAMQLAMSQSEPIKLAKGDWHLPYVRAEDWSIANEHLKEGRIIRSEPSFEEKNNLLIKVSAARCARVSYLTHDGRKTTVQEDVDLFNRLLVEQPLHASPAEHQATPDDMVDTGFMGVMAYARSTLHGNLVGWIQHRKLLPFENIPG